MKKKLKQKFVIMIFGPTCVGKSGFATKLAKYIPSQIVNCDIGQFYKPISIGTAKPNWKSSKIKQHLFDVIDEPKNYNVSQYRELLFKTIEKIWAEGDIPILVGGSGFYLKSLFFPPVSEKMIEETIVSGETNELLEKDLWNILYSVDQRRADKIDKNDIYRIKRALEICLQTGKRPSEFFPVFDFPSNFLFIFLNRERQELYARINKRTAEMIKNGWIQEVESLMGTEWISFLKKKKLIGYDVIIDYLKGEKTEENMKKAIETIQKKTRNYAKRQVTFWNSFERQLRTFASKESKIETIDLTLLDFDLYIKKLLNYLNPLFK